MRGIMKPYSETVTAYGELAADNTTPAGTAIVTIPAASLPSGLYRIELQSQMHTGANLNKTSNVEIRVGSTSKARVVQHLVANNAAGYNPRPGTVIYARVNGSQAISANLIAALAATETQSWICQLIATKETD